MQIEIFLNILPQSCPQDWKNKKSQKKKAKSEIWKMFPLISEFF